MVIKKVLINLIDDARKHLDEYANRRADSTNFDSIHYPNEILYGCNIISEIASQFGLSDVVSLADELQQDVIKRKQYEVEEWDRNYQRALKECEEINKKRLRHIEPVRCFALTRLGHRCLNHGVEYKTQDNKIIRLCTNHKGHINLEPSELLKRLAKKPE